MCLYLTCVSISHVSLSHMCLYLTCVSISHVSLSHMCLYLSVCGCHVHVHQVGYQRQDNKNDKDSESEEYEKYVNEAQFKIQILKQRRDRHEDLAKAKFKEMIERLQNDPRLAILNS
jgi:hypothetical protein